jgi:hypothetical protein
MKEIINILSKRYIKILQKNKEIGTGKYSSSHLIKMLNTLNSNVEEWPVDKTNRWLGFIQGTMTVYGILDVDEEREFTRPLFHDYYKKNNIKIVKTLDI